MTAEHPVDPVVGRAHRATEILHSLIYFAPEAEEQFSAVGLERGRMAYFAGRAAAMGPVGPGVVAATFYNFNPELVARHIPRAWALAPPSAVLGARIAAVDRAYHRIFGDAELAGPRMAELAQIASAVAPRCRPEGRPLYAAHAALSWPDPYGAAHLTLWHALTLLREHRGDGHIAALLGHGVSGIDAIVSHVATGRGFVADFARRSRGWSSEQWAAATHELQVRGILDPGGRLTEAGAGLRASVEGDTDRMAAEPWLSEDRSAVQRLIELGKELSRIAVANGAFQPGVFASMR